MLYLYVIGPANAGVHKIGYSAEPEKRRRTLQTGHAEKLIIHHTEPVEDVAKARLLEHLIHNANRHLKVNGEWYRLTKEQAINEVRFAIIRYADHLKGLAWRSALR